MFYQITNSFLLFLHLKLTEQQQLALYVCLAWLQLRCISFCMDWIQCKPWSDPLLTEGHKSPQILCLLSYTLYLPLMFLGPFVSFLEFEKGVSSYHSVIFWFWVEFLLTAKLNMGFMLQMIKSDIASWHSLKFRLLKLVLNSARFLGWMAVTEFFLHFIYCNAMQLHHEVDSGRLLYTQLTVYTIYQK